MNKKTWSFLIVTALLIVMTSLSAMKGSLEVGIVELVQGIFTGGNEDVEVIKDLRFPRIIIALFTGAALAVSGVLFQAVMKNPLADAGVIGISSGASFMTLVIITLFPQFFFWTPVFAFLGGALACYLVYSFSWKSGLSPLRIILIGIAINA
ncbi:iron ABC transporter permease, partial [Bacillus cereus]